KDLVLCNTELNPFTNIFCPTFWGQYRTKVHLFLYFQGLCGGRSFQNKKGQSFICCVTLF
ncbi:hypothetical protein, partial [uncultured Streptococcus sp.]|uniref:hypothetical protein n=1 Tax=uncultured Streptococcus sp. TaxID=83427 RepID=UPI0025969BDB